MQVCAVDFSVRTLLIPLIKKSMENNYEVHTVCTDTGGFKELESQGFTMFDINIDRKIKLTSNVKSIIQLYKLMRKEKYDIVHVHTPIASLLARIAAKLARVPTIIYTAHGFYFHEEMPQKKYRFYYTIEKNAAKFLTDYLLLQSKEDYNLAVANNFLRNDRIIHLSNGVEIWKKFNPQLISEEQSLRLKKELNLLDNSFVFTFVGRLVEEKGIFELMTAFTDIKEKYPEAELVIIGETIESERDQEAKIRLIEMLKYPGVKHLGFRTDIPELLHISNVFVLPSHREGLPRSIIEAMAMEKAIIATNIRGCREEVFPGENGILVEKANVEDLCMAMEKLVSNRHLAKSYGVKSRQLVEELFDEEKVLNKQIDLFDFITMKKLN
nr:glycosyltransferase family 4 protein [Sporosarcina sp. ACRSL]